MSQQIIFESRGKVDSKWVYGYAYPNAVYNLIVNIIQKDTNELYTVDKDSVGTFIGIYDKNASKVYSNDILQHPDSQFDNNGERAVVRYCSVLARFVLDFYSSFGGEGYSGKSQHISDYIARGWVVVGNTTDNKELLETFEGNQIVLDHTSEFTSEEYMKYALNLALTMFPAIALKYGNDVDHAIEIDFGKLKEDNQSEIFDYFEEIYSEVYNRFGESVYIFTNKDKSLTSIRKVIFEGKGSIYKPKKQVSLLRQILSDVNDVNSLEFEEYVKFDSVNDDSTIGEWDGELSFNGIKRMVYALWHDGRNNKGNDISEHMYYRSKTRFFELIAKYSKLPEIKINFPTE